MSLGPDPHNLARFVEAQRDTYPTAIEELRAGCKRSHWMWFIFPQIAGLGFSDMSICYAIQSLAEAKAYLGHPVLEGRLREATEAVLQVQGRSVRVIFGQPDDMKFRSSMTLFDQAAPEEFVFRKALATYFDGERDQRTLDILQQ